MKPLSTLLGLVLLASSAAMAGQLDATLSFSSDGGKTFLPEPPELRVGSNLLVKAKWNPPPLEDDASSPMVTTLRCPASDFASANQGKRDGAWIQRLQRYYFGVDQANSCVYALELSARPSGKMGVANQWDAKSGKLGDAPLPPCPALPPGGHLFQVRLQHWLKQGHKCVTTDVPFLVKVVVGEPAKPKVAAAKAAEALEEWLPELTGEHVFPISKLQAFHGAARPKLDGKFVAGVGDVGWRLEGIKAGDYHVRLLMEDRLSGNHQRSLGGASLFLNGVPVSFDHASKEGHFRGSWFAVVESARALPLKNGDVLRLARRPELRFGGLAISTQRLPSAPLMAAPITLDWTHDRFALDVTLSQEGRCSLKATNRAGEENRLKIKCEILDYFQRRLASFEASPRLENGKSFVKELHCEPKATDRIRAVVSVEDERGFKTERTVETLRDDLLSFRRKVWLNQGWLATGTKGEGLEGLEVLAPDAKWRAAQLPALLHEGMVPALKDDEHVAWFKRDFTLPAEMAKERIFVHFSRAVYDCRVFLNGRQVGGHGLGEAFDVELTGAVKRTGTNSLVVELRDQTAAWEPKSGTPRAPQFRVGLGEAWLFSAPPNMLGCVFPQTSFRKKELRLEVEVPPASFQPGVTLSAKVSLAGKELLSIPAVKLESPGVKTLVAKWANPPLWGPDEFPLLQLTTELKAPDGALLDRVETRFGFREFWAEGMDLKWNGVKANFASRPFLSTWGWMLDPNVRDKQRQLIQLARRNGCDMLRHIYSPEYCADIADEEGMPMAQGGPNTVVGPNKAQIDSDAFWEAAASIGTSLAKSLRQHPSIVEWYLSNEYEGESRDNHFARLRSYGEKVALADPTRIREFGCDLDLRGASPVISTHYPVDGSALRENGAYPPELFFWRRFNTSLAPGMKVPAGMFKGVANVFGLSPIVWGTKPIVINECCHLPFFNPPDGLSRLVGDQIYRDVLVVEDAWTLANRGFGRGHRDAQASAITFWRWITGNPNHRELPRVDVNILQRWNKFRSGADVAYDVNLNRDLHDAKTLQFRWELCDEDGNAVASDGEAVAFGPCELKREKIVLKLPEVAEEKVFTLAAELQDDAKTIASQTLTLHVYPLRTGGILGLFGSDLSKVAASVGVGLVDPAGKSTEKLRDVFPGLKAIDTPDSGALEGLGLLLVGENQAAEAWEKWGDLLNRFAADGGVVLLLHQNAMPRFLPVAVETTALASSTNQSFRPEHPLLRGVAPDELNYWFPKHKTGSDYLLKPKNGNYLAVVESGGPRGMEYVGLLEIPLGRGAFVCCQLDILSDYADNPVAWKLLRNVADFAAAPKAKLGTVPFFGKRELWLDKLGAQLEPATSTAALAGRQAAILNAAEAIDFDLAEALGRFVENGGTLLVLNADAANAKALETICGRRLTFRHAIPPFMTGRATLQRRGGLCAGLNNYDFFWKDRPDHENHVESFNSPEYAQAPLGGATVEAEGTESTLHPSFLTEVGRGAGRAVLCSLNLSSQEKRVKDHLSLISAALLTNLGVKLEAPRKASIPSGLTYVPIDISKALNRSFADEVELDGKGGWSDQGPASDLRSFPLDKDVQTFNGVPFRVERPLSCLTLSSKRVKGGADRAELPVGMKADALFFLHSCAWTTKVHHASFLVNYADGSSQEIKMIGGINLRDWMSSTPDEPFIDEEGTFTRRAWTGKQARFGQCSLYQTAWPNPWPDKEIKAVTVVSMKEGVPILVALTAGIKATASIRKPSRPETLAKAGKLLADADALFKSGDLAGAERLYQESIAVAWETSGAYLGLGYARERLGRRADAIAAYEALIAIDPKLYEPYQRVGRCHEADGNYAEALETYRRSLAMDPNQPEIVEGIKRVKAKLGQ